MGGLFNKDWDEMRKKKTQVDNIIDYLVNKKYRRQLTLEKSKNASLGKKGSGEIALAAITYEMSLKKMDKKELERLYSEEKEAEESDQFFNQANAEADFDYWGKMASWSIDEAIALSFGKDPRVVNEKSLSTVSFDFSFCKKYRELHELAKRAIKWKKLFYDVLPGVFIAWTKNADIPFPEELERKVIKYGGYVANWQTAHDDLLEKFEGLEQEHDSLKEETLESMKNYQVRIGKLISHIESINDSSEKDLTKPLHKKEKDSLLKLLAGMLMTAYNSKTVKASEVQADIMRSAGIELNDDTIRKYIKEAIPFIYDENEEGK